MLSFTPLQIYQNPPLSVEPIPAVSLMLMTHFSSFAKALQNTAFLLHYRMLCRHLYVPSFHNPDTENTRLRAARLTLQEATRRTNRNWSLAFSVCFLCCPFPISVLSVASCSFNLASRNLVFSVSALVFTEFYRKAKNSGKALGKRQVSHESDGEI